MPVYFVTRRYFAAAATAFLIAIISLISVSWGSTYDLAALDPPDVFTTTFDEQPDPLGHAAAARLVIRDRERPLLPDDRHAQRKACAGMLERSRTV